MNISDGFPGRRRWLALISASGWLFRVFGYIFAILVGGLVFALLSDGVSFIISLLWEGASHNSIRRYAWIAGAIISAVGVPLGWVNPGFFGRSSKKLGASSTTPDKVSPAGIPAPIPHLKPGPKSGELQGFWPSIWFFAFFGMVLGIAVSMLLVMAWFSLSASPFATVAMSESIQQSGGGIEENSAAGWSSQDPILITLMWMPAAVLTMIGVAVGFVYGVATWKRSRR